jgi:hypothetical protein
MLLMVNTVFSEGQAAPRSEEELRAWDWRSELKRQERSMSWLARHTERSESAVNKYASRSIPTPVSWLELAAAALGLGVGDAER